MGETMRAAALGLMLTLQPAGAKEPLPVEVRILSASTLDKSRSLNQDDIKLVESVLKNKKVTTVKASP